jgi:hypothetical protein
VEVLTVSTITKEIAKFIKHLENEGFPADTVGLIFNYVRGAVQSVILTRRFPKRRDGNKSICKLNENNFSEMGINQVYHYDYWSVG